MVTVGAMIFGEDRNVMMDYLPVAIRDSATDVCRLAFEVKSAARRRRLPALASYRIENVAESVRGEIKKLGPDGHRGPELALISVSDGGPPAYDPR